MSRLVSVKGHYRTINGKEVWVRPHSRTIEGEFLTQKKAREIYEAHRLELDRDIHTKSKKTTDVPTEAWAKNPSKSDVKGIDEPSALIRTTRIQEKKERIKQQRKQAKKKRTQKQKVTPKYAKFETEKHQYKAGKSWVSTATENWGVSGNFIEPYDYSKEGYVTTKYYKLADGRYIAETLGSAKHPHRMKFIVEGGKIIHK